MRYLSPLRYPGGKARLAPYLRRLIEAQKPRPHRYAEPFAGGGGAALHLLRDRTVEAVHLNDLNPGIAAFWRASLDYPNHFCRMIQSIPLTIDEWFTQRDIYAHPANHGDVELGFATFYLNRTNRSGILDARPIGGFDQTGRWKIDARFNRDGLCTRIQTVADMRHRIHVTEMEGLDFLATLQDIADDVFVYADPPYLVQGDGLYLHAFDAEDHVALARQLTDAKFPWILTYDDDPRITQRLYAGGRCATFDIAHTAHRQHVGKEAVIYSAKLDVPDLGITRGRVATWIEAS
ncbi:DNA adenine methylase [Austwickia chelonae]|uniref:site-specific DNA-methyltransferase (adenine-specific) n=1 Tax=Austwickia chelonae NBRC 105200 TaxID=1184607 RepID=K6V4G1_9MICO|nr:DNA adenine methylase [Austwickia chelonae]GAB76998.1 putative DNA methyltransferase [Austwickia chelonae NBRC 105200]SEW33160.1 DNA adenine methylase [Austwickia chelonae]